MKNFGRDSRGIPVYRGYKILDEYGFCKLHNKVMQACRVYWIMNGFHKRCIGCLTALR